MKKTFLFIIIALLLLPLFSLTNFSPINRKAHVFSFTKSIEFYNESDVTIVQILNTSCTIFVKSGANNVPLVTISEATPIKLFVRSFNGHFKITATSIEESLFNSLDYCIEQHIDPGSSLKFKICEDQKHRYKMIGTENDRPTFCEGQGGDNDDECRSFSWSENNPYNNAFICKMSTAGSCSVPTGDDHIQKLVLSIKYSDNPYSHASIPDFACKDNFFTYSCIDDATQCTY